MRSSLYAPKPGESAVQHAERIAQRGDEAERQEAQTFRNTIAGAGICWESRLLIARQMQATAKHRDKHVRPHQILLDEIAADYMDFKAEPEHSQVEVHKGTEANGWNTVYAVREDVLATLNQARRETSPLLKQGTNDMFQLIFDEGSGVKNAFEKTSKGYIKGKLKEHPNTALKSVVTKEGETIPRCLDDDTVTADMFPPIIAHCQEMLTDEMQAQAVTDYANTRQIAPDKFSWGLWMSSQGGNVSNSEDCITTIDTQKPATRRDEDGREVEIHPCDMAWMKDDTELQEAILQAEMERDNLKKPATPSLGATALKPFKFKNQRIDRRKKIGKMMQQEADRSYLLNSGIILSDLKLGLTTLAVATSRQSRLATEHNIKLSTKQLSEIAKQFKSIEQATGPATRRKATADRADAAKKRRAGAKASVAA